MKEYKKDIVQFFTWMRNGVAFVTSWLLILWLIYNKLLNIDNISTDNLIKLLLCVTGGVFLFASFFTRVFLKKWSFLRRLTCFMILISVYECIAFYFMGFWRVGGTFAEWTIFIGIVLGLYLGCIALYQVYSKKKGELYTLGLEKYQQKRSTVHGK